LYIPIYVVCQQFFLKGTVITVIQCTKMTFSVEIMRFGSHVNCTATDYDKRSTPAVAAKFKRGQKEAAKSKHKLLILGITFP
jgi:hypothetical protein